VDIWFKISVPSAPPSQLRYMSTLNVHSMGRWDGEERMPGLDSGHPPSNAQAKKMKSLTLHTHDCYRAGLRYWSSSDCMWDIGSLVGSLGICGMSFTGSPTHSVLCIASLLCIEGIAPTYLRELCWLLSVRSRWALLLKRLPGWGLLSDSTAPSS